LHAPKLSAVCVTEAVVDWKLCAQVSVPPEARKEPGAEADLLVFDSGEHALNLIKVKAFPDTLEQVTLGVAFVMVNFAVPDEAVKKESPP
jgi:hypothetical protein